MDEIIEEKVDEAIEKLDEIAEEETQEVPEIKEAIKEAIVELAIEAEEKQQEEIEMATIESTNENTWDIKVAIIEVNYKLDEILFILKPKEEETKKETEIAEVANEIIEIEEEPQTEPQKAKKNRRFWV
jgi:hypothetical protein